MPNMLEGKVAIVTGAGNGIGREIAIMMAGQGAKVIINDVGASVSGEGQDATPAQQTKAIIAQNGGQSEISAESVATWASAQKIVQAAMDHFGRIDIVVNNAGILRDQIFHRMTPEEWDSVIAVHLSGSFYVSRAAATHFRQQQSGAYVHMSSTSGLIGNFGQANYSAAKLGIVGLSQSIALDMARAGVRSNCIAPFAWSRLVATIPATTPDEEARIERLKTMSADKIAPLVAFLASDTASEVTNQIFGVRKNEIFLFSKPRPIRSMQKSEGWTPTSIAEELLPAFRPSFADPTERSGDIFSYDPI